MKNSLSAELNLMRPSLLETGLQVLNHNLNRKNLSLRLFEFGHIYAENSHGGFDETAQLCIYISGDQGEAGWRGKAATADLFLLKGYLEAIFRLNGVSVQAKTADDSGKLSEAIEYFHGSQLLGKAGAVSKKSLQNFDIKQPVFFAELNWDLLCDLSVQQQIHIQEIPRFPAVQRDLAVVVDKTVGFDKIEKTLESLFLKKLIDIRLFDVFESDKLGKGKKSLAISFTFQDPQKTLTDAEIDSWMNKIRKALEKDTGASIRQ